MSQTHRRAETIVGMPCPTLPETPFELRRLRQLERTSWVADQRRTMLPPARKHLPTLHLRDFPRRDPPLDVQVLAGRAVCLLVVAVMWGLR